MSLKVAESPAHSRNATLNDTPRKILVTLSSIKAPPREEAEALLRALGFRDGDIDAYNKKYGVDLKTRLTTEFSSKPPRPTKDSSPKPGFQTYIGVSDHNYKVMTDFLAERRGAAKQSLPIKPTQTAESKQVYDNSCLQALKLRQLADQAQVETTSFGIPNKLTDKTHIVATLPRNAAATADNALSAYIEKRYGGRNLFRQDKLDILNAAKASGVKVENLKVSQNNSRVVEFDLNLESL